MKEVYVTLLLITFSKVKAELEFELFTATQCHQSGTDDLVPNISYTGCIDECKSRDLCMGVSYRHAPQMCIIHPAGSTVGSEPGCDRFVYSEKSTWTVPDVSCGSQRCDIPRSTCSGTEDICRYEECENPKTVNPNLIVQGNRRQPGFKISIKCPPPHVPNTFVSLSCLHGGQWDDGYPTCGSAASSPSSAGQ